MFEQSYAGNAIVSVPVGTIFGEVFMLTSKSCNSSRDNKELCSWPSLGVLANFVNDS